MSETNEIQAAAAAHKRAREAGDARQKGRRKTPPVTPLQIGLGIGSAALAAAVLYMGRRRK